MARSEEGKIQDKIEKYLRELEKQGFPIGLITKRQAGGFEYKEGQADLWFVWDGVHIEIEIKTPQGELRTMQEKWMSICKQKKIICFVATSVNDVIEKFNAFGFL